jgi:hypothetical protein
MANYMENIKQIMKRINKRRTNMELETYDCTIKGLKDIHDAENPVKYWLAVDLDDGTERRLFVEQSCRQMNKGDRIKVHGYKIRKAGSINQTCTKIDHLTGDKHVESINNSPTPKVSNGQTVNNISASVDQWKEKYRLTMSNLLSSVLPSKQIEEYDTVFVEIDKLSRKILKAQYDGDEAPF